MVPNCQAAPGAAPIQPRPEVTDANYTMQVDVLRTKPPPGTSGTNGVSIAARSTARAGRSTGYGSNIIRRSAP